MDDTRYAVWILTLLLLLIVFIVFALTTCFVKRSCLKQLSNNQQRPLLANKHLQSTMKRAVLTIQVGFLEVCAGLVATMEAAAVKFSITRSLQPGGSSTHCSEHYQCAGQFHYVSSAIVCCLVLSIVRCLAQRFVLERLSKSDVVSMTRVYLVPATCLVTVLCVWSWFSLYDRDRERKQSDTKVCGCHVNQTIIPLNSFLLILLPIFWNLVIDYTDYRKGKTGLVFSARVRSQRGGAKYDSVTYDSISLKQTNLALQVVHSEDRPGHIPSETADSMSGYDNKIANIRPEISANATLPVVLVHSELSDEFKTVQFTDKTAEPTAFQDSLCDFLNIYTRLYLALVLYLAVLIGVYTFLANCHAHFGSADYTTAVFMTMLVMTGILRTVQITAAEVENRDGLKCEKTCQTNI